MVPGLLKCFDIKRPNIFTKSDESSYCRADGFLNLLTDGAFSRIVCAAYYYLRGDLAVGGTFFPLLIPLSKGFFT